ncbi:hypothetical protein ACHAWU_003826 [Discostella pseudostelligera]|uniref:Sulfhydryl oxidase n=1 Tax=Discostella pseudostelligera TaxID=259834 RepID=A0ABD3MEP8_9STRA
MDRPQYLYFDENGIDAANENSPVIEYLVPHDDHDGSDTSNSSSSSSLNPDFLYQPSSQPEYVPPPRVVVFYAPWCPHCVHYVPRYKQLATNVMSANPTIKFYAISCVAHNELCNAQSIHSFPTIKLFREGSYEPRMGKVGIGSNSVLRELGFDGVAVDGSDDKAEASGKKLHSRVTPFRDNDVHDAWSDAALSFEFALKNGIYMEHGPLADDKREAFRNWLDLLSKSLPAQMKRTHTIIDALLENFSLASSGQSELDDLVRSQVFSKSSLSASSWRTCTNGNNEMGYTCGLWDLFHIMSVGVVEYNRHNNPTIPTGHASETLRNYIDHFFQCDECRMNFLSMYDTCAFDGCHRLSENPSSKEEEWRELTLWLWETHNDVNVRLLGERLEANEESKPNHSESQQARWPSSRSCPSCWREDNSWEQEEVFNHLHNMYWSGNPSYIKIASDNYDTMSSGGWTQSLLRWKSTLVSFVFAMLIRHIYTWKRRKFTSGQHKK